jgi:hypothetical protein
MLRYLLSKQPPTDPKQPVQIKFAFDGGTMTSGKRIQQEQATLQILTDHALREVKSHTHAHQWMVYLGNENYETFQQELANSIPDILKLQEERKVLLDKSSLLCCL